MLLDSEKEIVMIQASGAEAIQLFVGGVLGVALSINMSNHGLSITNPETRWQSLALIGSFLFTFLVMTDLVMNPSS